MRRVAIVGAGGMGTAHADCYSGMQNAKVVAVMDIRPDAAAALAAQHDARVFSSAEEMMTGVDFDVLDICTPTPWHLDYIKMGAAAGKHICCEKPFARTLDECREAIKTCDKARVTIFVAHVLRWFPEFRRAKELIDAGAVGSPAIVRTTRAGGFPHAWNDWFANVEWSGGVVLDMIIHDFDWLLWTFGPAERVFARGLAYSGLEDKDYALVTIRFKNGVIGHVEGSWATPGGFRVCFEVAGDKGLINFDSFDAAPMVLSRWAGEAGAQGVAVPSSPTAVSPYFLELQHFIDCLEAGHKPDVTPQEAMAAVALSLAALESIRTGAPVRP